MSKNYVDLKVSDLREECKKKNLETTGLKVHLVERLNKFDKDLQNIENLKTNETKLTEQSNDVSNMSEITSDIINVKDNTPLRDSERSFEKIISKVKVPTLFEQASSEPENWESRSDVHLDFYNSDLHLVIDPSGYVAQTLSENGFEFIMAGVKANYGTKTGKVFFEVKLVTKVNVRLEKDIGESNILRVGWSANNSSLALGEEQLSFAYDNSGKKLQNNISSDYGVLINEGDIIGCFLDFNESNFVIRFSKNGIDQGEAFNIEKKDLNDNFLLPHICARNVSFEVNFGVENNPLFPPKTESIVDLTWTMIGKLNLNNRIRTSLPPKSKAECEVLMMCGLPSCGKTTWVEKMVRNNEHRFYNILSTNAILEKMKVMNLRKKCAGSRWDTFIQSATQCLNKLMELAVTRRRNFILDQTNVYPTAQRRRMKTFEEFIRKAIIIVPTDDEYQRRMNQVVTEEGKDVPESAVLQMKENFVIPEEKSDLFNEIIFIELQRNEAEDLVKKYNEEAKSTKKAEKDEHTSNKRSDREEEDSFGLWNESPKNSDSETSGQPVSKKSRWNDDESEEKPSKSRDRDRDRGSKSTSNHSTKKNEYKGGFCFDREADDTDKSARSGNRADDKSRSKDQGKSDRYGGGRSDNGRSDSYRERDKEHRERSGDKRGRSRERVSDQRSGYGQNRDSRPSRGSYNDRRSNNAYDSSADSRSRFPQTDYGGSSRFGGGATTFEPQEPRTSRFQVGQPIERGDGRGRGRGGAADVRGGATDARGGASGRGGYSGGRGGFQAKYSEFNPYETAPPSFNQEYKDNQEYDYKSATSTAYGDSNDVRGYGVPKKPTAGAGGRVVGARWGGSAEAAAGFDGGRQPDNYDEGFGQEESYYGGAGGQRGAPGRGGQKGAVYDSSSSRFGNADNNKSAGPATGPYYGSKVAEDTNKFQAYDQGKPASRFANKAESAQKFSNPYENMSEPSAYYNKADEASKFSNPYDNKPPATKPSRFGNRTDDSQRINNPYDTKSAPSPYGQMGAAGGYKSEEQTKFPNPYDTKSASGYRPKPDDMPQQSAAAFANPYSSKSGPSAGSYGTPGQSLHGAAAAGNYEDYQSYESTGNNQDYDYYTDDNQSNYAGAPSASFGGTAKQSAALAGASFKAPSSGSFKTPTTVTSNAPARAFTSAYNTQPIAAYGTQSVGGNSNQPTGAYGAQSAGNYGSQSAAAYGVQSTGGYGAQSAGGYGATGGYGTPLGAQGAQSAGGYGAPSGAQGAQSAGGYGASSAGGYGAPSGAQGAQSAGGYGATAAGAYGAQSTGGYGAQSTGAQGAQSSGGYGTPSTGGYGAQSSGGYGAQPAGGYGATSSGTQGAQSTGAYGTQSAGGYGTRPTGAYGSQSSGSSGSQSTGAYNASTGAYGAQATGTYKTPPSSAYNVQSSGNYNSSSSSTPSSYNAPASGPYKTPISGTYNAAPIDPYSAQTSGAYNAQSTAAYNAQTSGAYNAQSTAAYNAQSTAPQYKTPATAPYKAPPPGAYKTPSSGAYNTKTSTGVYDSNMASGTYGSYTNTPTGAYGNQSSGTYNSSNLKSSSSDSSGNPVAAGSYANPYSNCYENPSGTNAPGYDYPSQKATNPTKPVSNYSTAKQQTTNKMPGVSSSTNAPSNMADSSGYDDYSQYYGQY